MNIPPALCRSEALGYQSYTLDSAHQQNDERKYSKHMLIKSIAL